MLELVPPATDTMLRIPQYPEPAADGLDVMKEGYMLRKFIENAAHQAKVMPHQLDEEDDVYLKSYHRFMRNQFYLTDIEIVRDKILDGLIANKKIHDDALEQLYQDRIWAFDEHADAINQCIDMVDENNRRVSELHQEVKVAMGDLIKN